MGVARVSNERKISAFAAAALLLSSLDGVAVDNGGLSNQFVSERCAAEGEQNGAKKSSHFGHHTLVTPSRGARI